MQDGAELVPLDVWAARVIASGVSVSPPFVVDTFAHYFVARVRLPSFHAVVFDSIPHTAVEPLDSHVCDVVQALQEAGGFA